MYWRHSASATHNVQHLLPGVVLEHLSAPESDAAGLHPPTGLPRDAEHSYHTVTLPEGWAGSVLTQGRSARPPHGHPAKGVGQGQYSLPPHGHPARGVGQGRWPVRGSRGIIFGITVRLAVQDSNQQQYRYRLSPAGTVPRRTHPSATYLLHPR